MSGMFWDDASVKQLAEMLEAGELTIKEIASQLGRSEYSARMKVHREGLLSMTPVANKRRGCEPAIRPTAALTLAREERETPPEPGWPQIHMTPERAYFVHARRYMEAQLAEMRKVAA